MIDKERFCLFEVIVGISLRDFFDYDYEEATYQGYLNDMDSIVASGDDPSIAKIYVSKLTKLSLHKFQQHLEATQKDWHHSHTPQIYTVAKQLEAIAYLTGEQEAINKILVQFPLLEKIYRESDDYQTSNFLNNESPLKFPKFDKNLLTVQIMLRVLDPRFINQRSEQVCGVNSFVHNLALDDPLNYVKMVSTLALERSFDFQDPNTGKIALRIEISDNVANKNQAVGKDEIHDVDHIILNGLRDSTNKIVSYGTEGDTLSKQLFGVTTHYEVNHWMTNFGFHNVLNISMGTKDAIKQLQLLIKDGYRAAFASTSTLANYIIGSSERSPDNRDEPQKQNLINQFMDGHFFTIRNIEYNEQNDTVKVGIITWGEEVEAEIPFKVWKEQLGVVGQAVVGQPEYAYNILLGKAQEIVVDKATYCCSAQAYCFNAQNVLKKLPEFEEINKLLNEALNHQGGQTWLESAKKIQDVIEALPKAERDKLGDIPSKIAIIPTDMPLKIDNINKTIKNSTEKIEALNALGAENNIAVQSQLIQLYKDTNQVDKIQTLFASNTKYSATDFEIINESLLGTNQTIPDEVLSLYSITGNDLITRLSQITGLPEGGVFTYGLKGRLQEVVNQRRQHAGEEALENIDELWLDRVDVINFIRLLDKELVQKDPSQQALTQDELENFSQAILLQSNSLDDDNSSFKKSLYQETIALISEFFLKVASMISDNVVTKSIESTKSYKDALKDAQNNSPKAEAPIDAFSFRS